ncbi:MAG: hypothetical protein HXX80_05145 [Nitrososphaerales archaeon]|nr:hypothetical protein [Nitrososphaerales archaeon]
MASTEPSGQPMPIRTTVISMVVIGIGAIVFGFFARPYDAEVSTFLIAMGILLPVSAVFFYILYKKSVKNEDEFEEESMELYQKSLGSIFMISAFSSSN